jgi:hypothetical protein
MHLKFKTYKNTEYYYLYQGNKFIKYLGNSNKLSTEQLLALKQKYRKAG